MKNYKRTITALAFLALAIAGAFVLEANHDRKEAEQQSADYATATPVITDWLVYTTNQTITAADTPTADKPPQATEEQGAEAKVPTHPFTDEEVIMLAQTMHEEAQVVYWNGTNYGVSYQARQAAVGWTALNRYDNGGFGDTLAEVLSTPAQFAWSANAPVTDHFLALAEDIIERWTLEKIGAATEETSGRTLPSTYLFFEGDGRENHFREEYEKTGATWSWDPSMDPYQADTPEE